MSDRTYLESAFANKATDIRITLSNMERMYKEAQGSQASVFEDAVREMLIPVTKHFLQEGSTFSLTVLEDLVEAYQDLVVEVPGLNKSLEVLRRENENLAKLLNEERAGHSQTAQNEHNLTKENAKLNKVVKDLQNKAVSTDPHEVNCLRAENLDLHRQFQSHKENFLAENARLQLEKEALQNEVAFVKKTYTRDAEVNYSLQMDLCHLQKKLDMAYACLPQTVVDLLKNSR